ncbi:Fungalysin metallopeptidase-domain-containing protein [Gorgonomyces haynaldii]|nr:Fungalysin metallopeptidase-domain-containing protein [Gorgonomyces haynaldii]
MLFAKLVSCSLARRDASWPSYWMPEPSFQVFEQGAKSKVQPESSLQATCMEHVMQTMSFGQNESMRALSSHFDTLTGLYLSYMVKTIDNIDIHNSPVSVALDKYGNVRSRTSSWVTTSQADLMHMRKRSDFSCVDAVLLVGDKMQIPVTRQQLTLRTEDGSTTIDGFPTARIPVTCRQVYYKNKDQPLQQVYEVVVNTPTNYLNLLVGDNRIHAVTDYVSQWKTDKKNRLVKRQSLPDFKYLVVPWGGKDLDTAGQVRVTNPMDLIVSPRGWHDVGQGSQGITVGNNVFSTEGKNNPQGDLGVAIRTGDKATAADFDFEVTASSRADPLSFTRASIIQSFYISNTFHDILFRYGFDEASGNFQSINFSGKGLGGDPVISIVQSAEGNNNANFASPPDGSAPVMNMFLFTTSNPKRDGALDNTIVIHELTHGLSNRLTGGSASSNCLNGFQAGGMGEGWSDAMALVLEMKGTESKTTSLVIGGYAANDRTNGVRRQPYSTLTNVNARTYADLATTKQVHNVGETWATMLIELYFNLVEVRGFDPNFKTNVNGGKGNNVWMQLVVGGMKLQPCNPTFVSARDAILMADQILFQSQFKCQIGRAFAKRGLGLGATATKFVNDGTLPSGCSV